MKKTDKKKAKMNVVAKIIGSIVLAVGSMVIMPKVIDFLSEKMTPDSIPKKDDDDWGPEIVKKDKEQGE